MFILSLVFTINSISIKINIMNTKERKDEVYVIMGNETPLSWQLPTRDSKAYRLTHKDPKTGTPKALRYARNQSTFYQEDQKGEVILEITYFTEGMLVVSKDDPLFQDFLKIHPDYNKKFKLQDKGIEAQATIDAMDFSDDIVAQLKKLEIDQIELVARVLFGKAVHKMTSAEMKRDLRIEAMKNPSLVARTLNDPSLKTSSKVQQFFDYGLLNFRDNKLSVYFNTPASKKRMLVIPPETSDSVEFTKMYLESKDGKEDFSSLELYLSELK